MTKPQETRFTPPPVTRANYAIALTTVPDTDKARRRRARSRVPEVGGTQKRLNPRPENPYDSQAFPTFDKAELGSR